MAPIDQPFRGLDEVWVWPAPQPQDAVAVTAIGGVGGVEDRVAIVSWVPRLIGGVAHRIEGRGAWAGHDLGELGLPRFASDSRPFDARPCSGDARGRWTAGGRFEVGDVSEASAVASRGRPPRTTDGWRDVAGRAVALGRSLAHAVRGDRAALDALDGPPVPPLGDEVDSPLTALGGWLTAVQHHKAAGPGASSGPTESWQLVLDASRPAPASPGLAVVIAALGLVHHPQLVYGRPA